MKKGNWIKLPNGHLAKRKSSRLVSWLAENEIILSTEIAPYSYTVAGQEQASDISLSTSAAAFNASMLYDQPVMFFGAGSVGSHMAYNLGLAQPAIRIVDFKKVEARHTHDGRTIYDPTLINLYKVDALKKKLERDCPGTTVISYPYNVAEIPDVELKVMFAESLLVILAIDDAAQILRIAELCYPIVELIQVAMHAGGLSGHIAITVPCVTPCLLCTLGVSSSQEIRRLDSEPANSCDIMTVAQQAARIAIDIMYSKVTGKDITRWDTSKNLIYITNTRDKMTPDGPGIVLEGSRKRRGCLICNRY